MKMVTFPMYVHNKSGNTYYKLSPAKIQWEGVWYDAIAYKSADTYHSGKTEEIFCRTVEDFEKSFTLV